MQSGISASQDLHSAFANFLSDTTLFALPITIQSESLIPLPPLPTSNTLPSSLDTLKPHLQPKTPIYLLLRLPSHALLTAITYVPSTSPVRSKTLFASTRSSLIRELGLEKFGDTIFVTEPEEILDPGVWDNSSSDKANETTTNTNGGAEDGGILSVEERELQSVKRAEEEERHGTQGRPLNMGAQGGSGLKMKMTGEAEVAFEGFKEDGGLVQFGIDVGTETLELLCREKGVRPEEVRIPGDRPSYSFYRGEREDVLFIYVCPGTAKVKERMVAASSRSGVVAIAKANGITVSKRIEASEVEDVTAARITEELGGGTEGSEPAGAAKQGFARPKRPGRR